MTPLIFGKSSTLVDEQLQTLIEAPPCMIVALLQPIVLHTALPLNQIYHISIHQSKVHSFIDLGPNLCVFKQIIVVLPYFLFLSMVTF